MSAWQRLSPLEGPSDAHNMESWIHTPVDGVVRHYPVRVTNGKPFDVLSLKGTHLTETRDYAAFLRKTAAKLYAPDAPRRTVAACPCCGAETKSHSRQRFSFMGIPFHRCDVCGHGFVLEQPSEAVLNTVFADSEDHSATYVERESLEARMREIITPKVDWTVSVYSECHGRNPRSGIDVGAGGGHFVEGMRRAGLDATGYELSRASHRFAAEAFGIELLDENFLRAPAEPVDLVTFWGLLEYTPEPRRFPDAARRRLEHDNGLLVVEVPRLDCLGTAVQAQNPFSIARHMDPTSHVNTFSDASLATALVETGFVPVAAWYFGMDVYELLIQAALRLDDATVVDRLADMIPALQQTLDLGRQCDDLVLAAVPAA